MLCTHVVHIQYLQQKNIDADARRSSHSDSLSPTESPPSSSPTSSSLSHHVDPSFGLASSSSYLRAMVADAPIQRMDGAGLPLDRASCFSSLNLACLRDCCKLHASAYSCRSRSPTATTRLDVRTASPSRLFDHA